MTSSIRRLFLALSIMALLASGCGSSAPSESAGVSGAEPASEQQEAPTTPAVDSTEPGDQDPDLAVPDDDPAAEEAIAGLDGDTTEVEELPPSDPLETAQGFVRGRFNVDPTADEVACIVDQSDDDANLEAALISPAVQFGEVDDVQLKALSFAINGCVSTISLADWATQAAGPQGDVRDTAPPCFEERFDDPDRGDVTFYTFVALTYQFRVEPDGVPDVTDALVSCVPVTALSDFFANQAEAESNYDTVIDRTCFVDTIDDRAVSEEFWMTLIEGLIPPVTVMAPYLAECAEVANADLSQSVPDDFVPWSATGALASVVPAARANLYTEAPPMSIDPTKEYEAVLATAGSEVRVRLFAAESPSTVNNFVSLARDGYYDGTTFHRVLEGFMAQAGDPSGTGAGSPGYTFADEVDNGLLFDRPGLLGMANTGPDSNGSQFFITTVPTDHLDGLHTIFGEVVEGQDVVNQIRLRDPLAPNGRGQILETVTIIES